MPPTLATRLLSPGLLHLVEELLAVRPAPRDCGHAPAGVAQQLLVGCERQRALLEVLRVAAQREARLNVLHRRARPSLLQVVQRVLSHVGDAQRVVPPQLPAARGQRSLAHQQAQEGGLARPVVAHHGHPAGQAQPRAHVTQRGLCGARVREAHVRAAHHALVAPLDAVQHARVRKHERLHGAARNSRSSCRKLARHSRVIAALQHTRLPVRSRRALPISSRLVGGGGSAGQRATGQQHVRPRGPKGRHAALVHLQYPICRVNHVRTHLRQEVRVVRHHEQRHAGQP